MTQDLSIAYNMLLIWQLPKIRIREGRWTWEGGEKWSVVDYIVVPCNLKRTLKKMVIEDGQLRTGSNRKV